MNKEIEEILFWFFCNIAESKSIIDYPKRCFKPTANSSGIYRCNYKDLQIRFDRGWDSASIKERLISAKDLKTKTNFINQVIPINPIVGKEDQNLLNDKEKFYHVELKEITYPEFNEDGELIESGEIHRRQSFTLNDLISYYYSTLRPTNVDRKEVGTIMKYYLNTSIKLDDILTAIDLWLINSTETNTGNNPWDLKNFISAARSERIGVTS